MPLFEFEIRAIDPINGTYSVFAEDADDEAEKVIFTEGDLNHPFGAIQAPLSRLKVRQFTADGPVPFSDFASQEAVCIEIGKRLFAKFFVGLALERFRQYRGANNLPRLALRLPAELYHIPWELLHDPMDQNGKFLSLQGSVTRCDSETPARLFSPIESSSFLFVLSSPYDMAAIADFDLLDVQQFHFIKVTPATYPRFEELVGKSGHFGLIFFGHGEVDEAQYGRLIFVREERQFFVKRWIKDPKYGHSLGDAFGPGTEARLACIFACESAWADKKVQFDRSIVGACLRQTKLAFVLGAQTPLDLFVGQECLARMLDRLAAGDPLDLALRKARIAVRAIVSDQPAGRLASMDWWIPALYSKTTNLDILPKAPLITSPEVLPKDAVPLTQIPLSMTTLSEAAGFFKAVGQKFAHIASGESNRLKVI